MGKTRHTSPVLFEFDGGKPPVGELAPLALQHVVAAVVGVVTPAVMVADAFGTDPAQRTVMVQAALVLAGVLTIVQAFPLFRRIGSGLPVIMGTSFAFVPAIQSFAGTSDLGAVFGAQIAGGIVAVVFGLLFRKLRRFFPPVVTGTVVMCIGLSLYTVAIGYMAGGQGAEDYGSLRNWTVALVTLVVCVALSNFGKGVLKLGSLLFGLLAGYAVAAVFGMVGFDGIEGESWFTLPALVPFTPSVDPAVTATLVVVSAVVAVQLVGDLSSLTVGALDRQPTDRELTGGIVSYGAFSVLGALIGAVPAGCFGQNVGIAVQTKVVNRWVFATAGAVLLAAGLLPRFAFVLANIPQAVIGGATVTVFGTIAMTGVRILTRGGFTQRDMNVAGLSLALGMGVSLSPGCLAGPAMPEWVASVFGSSAIVIATICAVLLNQVLPRSEEDVEPAPIEPDTEDPDVAEEDAVSTGGRFSENCGDDESKKS